MIIATGNIIVQPAVAQEEDSYIGPGRIEVEAGKSINYDLPELNTPEVNSIYFYGTVGVKGGILPVIIVQLYDSETGQMYINRRTTYDDFGVYLPMGREYTLEFTNDALFAGETKYVDADFYARPVR